MSSQDKIHVQVRIALADAETSRLWAEHYKLRIESGVWKERVGKVGLGFPTSPDYRLMTEAEVLADEVDTHQAHIRRYTECLDVAKNHAQWLN